MFPGRWLMGLPDPTGSGFVLEDIMPPPQGAAQAPLWRGPGALHLGPIRACISFGLARNTSCSGAGRSENGVGMSQRFETIRGLTERVKGFSQLQALAVWDLLLDHQHHRQQSGLLAEIGVAYGLTAAVLALHARPAAGEALLLFDLSDRLEGDVRTLIRTTAPDPAPAVRFHAGDSRLWRRHVRAEDHGAARWVHIDGEHSGEAVTSDLDLAHHLLQRTGIVCVDDFFSPRYPQVTQAVFEYQTRHPDRFRLFLCGFNKGWLCRPSALAGLIGFATDHLQAGMTARGIETVLYKTASSAELNCIGIGPARERPTFGPDWAVDRFEAWL